MFNIIKFCNEQQAKPEYKKLVTNNNDPSISRRMRYSQMVRNYKYKSVNNFKYAKAPEIIKLPAHLYPKGQIYGYPNELK